MKRRLLLLSWLLLASVAAIAHVADTVSARLDYQRWIFPQEKIHVTTDKPYYTAGDTIWLRAFVVDAASHQPVHASRFVYVELRPPMKEATDSVTMRVKLREQDGVFKGYLPLDEHMAEGDYLLTAYTMFMQSQDEAFFFKRSIMVMSAYATRRSIAYRMTWAQHEPNPRLNVTLKYRDAVTGEELEFNELRYSVDDGYTYQRFNKRGEVNFTLSGKEARGCVLKVNFDGYEKLLPIPHDDSDCEVAFFPEGGYLVPGVKCRTAFKALAGDGSPLTVTGHVTDDQGREVATIATEHDGMGAFSFVPQVGRHYVVSVTDSTGRAKTFELPATEPTAAIVKADHNAAGTWRLRAVGQVPDGAVIVLQQRGVMVGAASDSLVIDEASLQPGVVEALLVDAHYRVLSRRLLFVKGDHSAQPSIIAPERVTSRQHVNASLALDGFNVPQGNYAVTVTDDASIVTDSTANILTQLLLQSELRGSITNPVYYFGNDTHCSEHLDLLMLTHGWTRYDIPQVVSGIMAEPRYPIEAGQAISGRVLSEWRKKPLAGATVSVIAPQIGWADVATTNDEGYFSIEISSLPDSVQCVLQAYNKKGKHERRLVIDPEEYPSIASLPQRASLGNLDETQYTSYVSNERSRILSSGDMRNIMLSEIVVLSKVKHRDVFQVLATRSMDEVAFQRRGITSIEQALRNIPGIWISGGSVYNLRTRDYYHPQGYEVPIFINSDFGTQLVGNSVAGAEFIPNAKASTDMHSQQSLSNQSGGNVDSKSNDMRSAGSSLFEMGNLAEAESMIVSFQDVKKIDFIPPGVAAFLGSQSSLYGAIVITTKSGLDKPKNVKNWNLHFITPLGYQRPAECYNQKYENGDNGGIAPGMDQRNLLYWNPCVKVGADGKSSFDFYANDVEGTSYTVTIEGVTDDGEIICTRRRIVKQ
ncbi:MAG: hypothetical protein J6I72_00645 [Muribaculaceae bacterium]|nr:hypothetical protein [Muribaculaceae bacterium]